MGNQLPRCRTSEHDTELASLASYFSEQSCEVFESLCCLASEIRVTLSQAFLSARCIITIASFLILDFSFFRIFKQINSLVPCTLFFDRDHYSLIVICTFFNVFYSTFEVTDMLAILAHAKFLVDFYGMCICCILGNCACTAKSRVVV